MTSVSIYGHRLIMLTFILKTMKTIIPRLQVILKSLGLKSSLG